MAMTGRLYSVSFQNVTLAAVQDLFSLTPGSSHVIGITSINLGQITGTTVANLRVRLRRAATFTAGSGGSAFTPTPWVQGDVAASTVAGINETTQSTSTFLDSWDDVWNTVNNYLWVPPIPSRPLIIPPGGGFVLSLDTAPSSLVSNGTITFEELP
jgi:hypothetical protein